jgi:hypothetical protein
MAEPRYPRARALDPGWTADTVAVQAGRRPDRVAGARRSGAVTPAPRNVASTPT